eukprot:TRINITY_DN91519_c0_g1_i1.p1 TRINITY_DN91519_c0_g1~~TRINITY_DN91519_c0_g1_i1.p1  ORF type:complete len:214 (-),score=37.43 TRINITY_DN91519_c0_g1_i1:79-720(-)
MSSDPLLQPEVDDRGIPVKSDYPDVPIPILYAGFNTTFLAISLGIGFMVYSFGATQKYDAKIAVLKDYDLGWFYLGFVMIKLGSLMINLNLGMARKEAKVNVPDQQVYKVHDGGKGYVLMEKEGVIGRFNRAQRAYMNFLETAPIMIGYFMLSGWVFPFPTFVCATMFSLCRVMSAVGYTRSAKERLGGNITGAISMAVMEAFVLIAGFKAVM